MRPAVMHYDVIGIAHVSINLGKYGAAVGEREGGRREIARTRGRER